MGHLETCVEGGDSVQPPYGTRQFVELTVQIPCICMCVTTFYRSVTLLASHHSLQINHNPANMPGILRFKIHSMNLKSGLQQDAI